MADAATSAGNGRNNPWLDLVRSIAILLVLFRHGERALNAETEGAQGVLQTIAMNGWVGVDLFFVLSGYLISRHLLRAGLGTPSFHFGRYIALRALRIVPAYFAALLLVVAGVFPFYQVAPEALGVRIAYHLLFLQDYLPSNVNVVFWSLGVEEKFYLLAPLAVFALVRCRKAWMLVSLLLLLFLLPLMLRSFAYVGMDGEMSYPQFWRIFRSPFHMVLEGLLLGAAIAVIEYRGYVRNSQAIGLALFVSATTLFAVWLGTHDFLASIGAVDVLLQPSAVAIVAAAMVCGAVQLAGTAMPLAASFRWLASLSYSLYLIHFPLIPMALMLASHYGSPAFWACYMASSFAAALALHYVVERPFLQWKDRLSHSHEIRLNAPLAAAERA